METTYYNSIVLNKYLIRPDKFLNKKFCLEYSDGQNYRSMGSHYQKDLSLLLWNTNPTKEMLETVRFLKVIPPIEDLFPIHIPPFLANFQNLEVLSMPLIFALSLTKQNAPLSVKNLTLINDRKQVENFCVDKKKYAEKLIFPNITFSNVEGLSLVTLSTATTSVDNFLNINNEIFPNLEFLRCIIGKTKVNNLNIKNLLRLKHLWVTVGKDVDITKHIPNNLETLYIDGTNAEIKFSNMEKKHKMKILKINSYRFEINCEDLAYIDGLEEIIISNSKFVKNIEAILKIDTIRSIEIVNCKNSFTKNQKQLFKNVSHRFDRLSIDFT